MKKLVLIVIAITVFCPLYGEPLYSPTWGFKIDLPEGYSYSDGNGFDRFNFKGPQNTLFDIVVYNNTYNSISHLVEDVNLRLKNQGETSFFEYREKPAALLEIKFDGFTGWGFCVELAKNENSRSAPLLLAMAYTKSTGNTLDLYHLSALDSIAPAREDQRYPGPITEFSYPRGELKKMSLSKTGLEAMIREYDSEGAQALVDREFALLRHYVLLDSWKEAWIRFYRAIYRDSWDRLIDAAFQLEREWNVSAAAGYTKRDFARQALGHMQGFKYERDLDGSDFINLVSAVTEGKGDCDSRAMLWAIILTQANIPAAMMVSREHSHAMGLADVEGIGARFEVSGKKWLVAETIATVDIGLIAQEQSAIESWLGVMFE